MKGFVAILLVTLVITSCGGDGVSDKERQRAIEEAHNAYRTVVARGIDLERGPCIAEELTAVPGWSVDIAHDPRQPVDEDPFNQCQLFRRGKTHHFVELDPDGELIRVK